MSGIAGIYNLDGRPVDPALLSRMTDAIAHRGPDRSGRWINGAVGLSHAMLSTTPESIHEKQPLLNESGDVCLTLDGRVDNREELRAALEAKGARLRADTDAELVLRAYETWGEDSPAKIIGDFAFAIWDGRNRQLFCARDFLGIKPLYYNTNYHTFLFASELHQLFEDVRILREPNEGMIGEYLSGIITDTEETLYHNIFRLPPAHSLLISTRGIKKKRYWDIDPGKEIRYGKDSEYAQHFFQVFKEAVGCRLRSHTPLGAYLSGGLDSSSVVVVAQSLFQAGIVKDRGFETFSMHFPQVPACDESDYILEVVRMWDLKSNAVFPEEAVSGWYAEQARRYLDIPDYPNGAIENSVKALAKAKGIKVLLTGTGGDEALYGSLYSLADLLRQCELRQLIRELHIVSKKSGITIALRHLLSNGLRLLLPKVMRRVLKTISRRDVTPPGIDSQFARKIDLKSRLKQNHNSQRFQSIAQKHVYEMSTSGTSIHGMEMQDQSAASFGIEERHPFKDRRILEFALALPEEQRTCQGTHKIVLRHAMRGLLPEKVRQRHTKADFSHVFPKAMQTQVGRPIFHTYKIASAGWIDAAQASSMYERMEQLYAQGDASYVTYMWQLWMIYSLELWYTAICSGRQRFSSPQDNALKRSVSENLEPTRL